MVQKGGFSFVAMLVINPVVILFYQNCSMAPISHASKTAEVKKPAISRSIASEQTSAESKIKCETGEQKCIHSTFE